MVIRTPYQYISYKIFSALIALTLMISGFVAPSEETPINVSNPEEEQDSH